MRVQAAEQPMPRLLFPMYTVATLGELVQVLGSILHRQQRIRGNRRAGGGGGGGGGGVEHLLQHSTV